jgi:putative sterol carrier protein
MVTFLSQDWLDEWLRHGREQPRRPGVTARIEYLVKGAPAGDTRYYWLVKDGQLEATGLGEPPGGAELTLTLDYEHALRIGRGETTPNMAFMRGWVKATGKMGMLVTLLPITGSAAYKEAQRRVAEVTEYPSAVNQAS